jgi:hypothetical protein
VAKDSSPTPNVKAATVALPEIQTDPYRPEQGMVPQVCPIGDAHAAADVRAGIVVTTLDGTAAADGVTGARCAAAPLHVETTSTTAAIPVFCALPRDILPVLQDAVPHPAVPNAAPMTK